MNERVHRITVRFSDRELEELDAGVRIMPTRGRWYRPPADRSEFIRKAVEELAARLLQERRTRLEERPTAPATSDSAQEQGK